MVVVMSLARDGWNRRKSLAGPGALERGLGQGSGHIRDGEAVVAASTAIAGGPGFARAGQFALAAIRIDSVRGGVVPRGTRREGRPQATRVAPRAISREDDHREAKEQTEPSEH